MFKKTVMPIFGTRPEAIKMCPLILELEKRETIHIKTVVTGQHRELLSSVLDLFGIYPAYHLALMTENQTQEDFLSAMLLALPPILRREKPDLVLVHGDTASAYAASLICFLEKIPVAHVEAGLRTYQLHSPFPEEFYRQSIARMATLHFAPTEHAKNNLLSEKIPESNIYVTGNTGIDALSYTVRTHDLPPVLSLSQDKRLILVTAHRRENHGAPLCRMLKAIRAVAREREDIFVLISAHPNPAVTGVTKEIFAHEKNCCVLPAQEVSDFHTMIAHSYLILTDSGGIQEEAPALHIPVLVMREETERQEGVAAGTLRLIGTDYESIYAEFCRMLNDKALYKQMQEAQNPYGDGKASVRIADTVEKRCSHPNVFVDF